MSSVDENTEIKNSSRRSKKVRNLEEEVESIFSQDDGDEEIKDEAQKEEKVKEILTPRASQAVKNENMHTPRRSCRKSIKPSQDYDDIVNRSLRSGTRSAKKSLQIPLEEREEKENKLKNELEHPKWTPAEVGRVSQRRGRKSKRKGKKIDNKDEIEINENPPQIDSNDEMKNVKCMELLEAHEESIHLIQEDSEDAKVLTQKSTEEDLCIVFENNLSHDDIETENGEKLENIKENFGDTSFGSYLNSKDINISELGLNPIKDEDDEIKENMEPVTQDAEEMPSLIVCDDEEEGDKKIYSCSSIKLNETFEANDSVELVEDEEKISPKARDVIMESLKISDDESNETPKKQPRIVLTDTKMQNQTILPTPQRSSIKSKLPCTPTQKVTPKMPTTPKQTVKPIRFPTPYRNKYNFKFNKKIEDSNVNQTETKSNVPILSLTTLEPKEIVLRGIRKRSLSVCIDGNDLQRQKLSSTSSQKVKQDRMVSFYSPANQTTIIDELDDIIAKSLKKQKPQQTKEVLNRNVTTRRKRSISFDDSMISKLPRPVLNQNVLAKNQTTTSTSITRTKLPNFAAIHQKHFQKMENLVDHISRKQERSKNLINSATKLKQQASKNASIIKNSNNISLQKPKAIKKIDLSMTLPTAKTDDSVDKLENTSRVNNPPGPRGLAKTVKPSAVMQRTILQQQDTDKYLKPSNRTNIDKTRTVSKAMTKSSTALKPSFNLSTSLMAKTSFSTASTSKAANTSLINNDDKMASRLQRHMELFKGRGGSAKEASAATRKNEILRGVRSNRRFELQMQHRRNMDL